MPRRPRARSLSIFLIKEEASTIEDILVDPVALTQSAVTVNGQRLGDLYIKSTTDKTPLWLSLFEGAISVGPVDLHNASAAAVLILKVDGRTFALAFGYGRSLLKPGAWEEDFGLRVTLNVVDPSKIKSVDRVKFDAISQHSQIQASRDANIVEFGLDVEQDLLRAVTGKPRDATLASQLTGKDALKADVRVSLADLPGLLLRFKECFGRHDYREHFSWVDQVNEVKDPTVIQSLDSMLIEKIRSRDFERLWLGIPDRVEWEGMAGFRYRDSVRAQPQADIHFTTFLQDAGEHFIPTVDVLKKRKRVYLISHESEAIVATWPLYRCIYCEIDSSNETFLLNNGKWYRISPDFLGVVNSSFDEVIASDGDLPNYNHHDEEAYNLSAADNMPDTFFLMDQKFVRCLSARDPIEFCDLYSSQKKIIHVKRYRGSATLSHLFSQGVVSGELFCRLPEFRQEVNDLLPPTFQLANTVTRPNSEEFEVVFAIISKSTRALTLPFFSRVNLRNAVQRLKALGYKVSITKIQAN